MESGNGALSGIGSNFVVGINWLLPPALGDRCCIDPAGAGNRKAVGLEFLRFSRERTCDATDVWSLSAVH